MAIIVVFLAAGGHAQGVPSLRPVVPVLGQSHPAAKPTDGVAGGAADAPVAAAPPAAAGSSAPPATQTVPGTAEDGAAAMAPAPAPPAAPGTAPPVAATSPSIEAESARHPRLVAALSHELQFGLALLFGDGYRGIFPYDKDVACGDAKSNDNRVCTNRAPAFMDLQPSFGLSEHWDFLADLRFGLTADFNTYHQFYVMPGFRYWMDPQRKVKFFSTMQLAYDRSNQNSPPNAPHVISDNDLGFRNSNGLMVEIMRNFGVYFQFGETIAFYRWLSFMADAGIGVQARVP